MHLALRNEFRGSTPVDIDFYPCCFRKGDYRLDE